MASSSSAGTGRWFPPPFSDPTLELTITTILQQLYGLEAQAIAGVGNGQALASGQATVTGSENAVATGLKTVTNVIVGIDGGAAAFFEIASGQPSTTPGAIDLFVWQSGPAASTTPRLVRWIAIGTPTQPLGGATTT